MHPPTDPSGQEQVTERLKLIRQVTSEVSEVGGWGHVGLPDGNVTVVPSHSLWINPLHPID